MRDFGLPTILHVALISVALAACGGGESERPPAVPEEAGEVDLVEEVRVEGASDDSTLLPPAELARARETAAALGQELAGLLFTTLESEGPVAAVRICSEVAQQRTESFATDGVYVRRISDRLRNPLNAPDEGEARELRHMETLEAEGRLPAEIVRVVRRGDERSLHLMRPIRLQPACLTCHGESSAIPPEVRAILAERYPGDQAVGYEAGDLRGAISVRVPITAQ